MKLRTVLLLLLLAILLGFAAVNWSAFVSPTRLSLIVTSVEAPIGLIMLSLFAVVVAFFLIFIAYLQTASIVDARRHARELQSLRELADRAEASRLAELRGALDTGLAKLEHQVATTASALEASFASLEQTLGATIEQTGNGLSASIGELEERLTASRADGSD